MDTSDPATGSDCLVRDAQRVVTLSATEKFDGVDGVINTLLPFHIYSRQSQLDNDYAFAMNLVATETASAPSTSAAPPAPSTKETAMRRMLASRTDVFEAHTLRKANVVRKRLRQLQQRIDRLERKNDIEVYCELMLHVCDASSREFAVKEANEREEKRKREEKLAEETRLKAEREARLREERARWQAEEAANAAKEAALVATTAATANPATANPAPANTDASKLSSVPLKPSGSLKLKLSMKKDATAPLSAQQLRAGSGANFMTSPAGQTSLTSHNPQMSGDASRMSPGLTDGATLLPDSRAMSVEIDTEAKRDEDDDVVSKQRDVGTAVAPSVVAPSVVAPSVVPAAAASVQQPVAVVPKAPVSGKFKLMKLMNKKK